MRNITEEAVRAFNNSIKFNKSNTEVKVSENKVTLSIFGNVIAIRENGKLFITNCGWQSNTTKERLNALDGVSIQQKKGKWYLNGVEWNGNLIQVK